MPKTELWAGALSLLLHHSETACPHAASQAARLLECISDASDLDEATRALCDRASIRLSQSSKNPGFAK